MLMVSGAVCLGGLIGTAEMVLNGSGRVLRFIPIVSTWSLHTQWTFYLSMGLLPWIFYVSKNLFMGAAMSRLPYVEAGPWVVTGLLLGLSFLIVRFLLWRIAQNRTGNPDRPLVRFAEAAGFALAAVMLHHADLVLYPKLYGYLHVVLAACSVILMQVAWLMIRMEKRFHTIGIVGWAIWSLGVMGTGFSIRNPEAVQIMTEHTALNAKIMILFRTIGLTPVWPPELDYDLEELCDVAGSILPRTPGTPEKTLPVTEKPNVLLIVVDALRADHLGAYGYPRPTSPTIDSMMQRGTQFRYAQAHGNKTYLSAGSFLWSCPSHEIPLYINTQPNIMQLLKENGYYTFTSVPEEIFRFLPEIAKGCSRHGFRDPDPLQRTESVLQMIDAANGNPFFGWVQYYSPHTPYQAPSRFHSFGDRLIDLYDMVIRYDDHGIGKLIQGLAERELLRNTILIFTSDHGEGFMDHGALYHGTTLHQEQLDVPLGFVASKIDPGILNAQAAHGDIYPTILSMTGIRSPFPLMGMDLTPGLIHGQTLPARAIRSVMEPSGESFLQRPWKLIADSRQGTVELYDLEHDPAEKTNLAFRNRGQLRDLQLLLRFSSFSEIIEDVGHRFSEEQIQPFARHLLTSPGQSEECRALAIYLLASNRQTQNLELIADILESDPSPVIRRETATALRTSPPVTTLLMALHPDQPAPSPPSHTSEEAQRKIIVAEELLRSAQLDPDPEVRIAAWKSYGMITKQYPHIRDVEVLFDACPSQMERREILRAILRRDHKITDPFFRTQLRRTSDTAIISTILRSFLNRSVELDSELLERFLDPDYDVELRRLAVCGIARNPEPGTVSLLQQALDDESPGVCSVASHQLAKRCPFDGMSVTIDQICGMADIEMDQEYRTGFRDDCRMLCLCRDIGKPFLFDIGSNHPEDKLEGKWGTVTDADHVYYYRFVQEEVVQVAFDLDRSGPGVMAFRMFAVPRGDDQPNRINVEVNGKPCGTIHGYSDWRLQELVIPDGVLLKGNNQVRLIHQPVLEHAKNQFGIIAGYEYMAVFF